MNLLYQLFRNANDAIFGIDCAGRICFWNFASEQLFGLSKNEVLHSMCYSVISGYDFTGAKLCSPDCIIRKKILNHECVNNYDLIRRKKEENSLMLNLGVYIMPVLLHHEEVPLAFFIARTIDPYQLIRRLAVVFHCPSDDHKFNLTSREREILDMASRGFSTNKIAEHFAISKLTVRKHFKNAFSKMGVHSRVEAISLILRSSLLT